MSRPQQYCKWDHDKDIVGRMANGSCRACNSLRGRTWYKANTEKTKARAKAWAAENPEKARASCRAWAKANHEKMLAQARAWAAANPERMLALIRAWEKANPERMLALIRAWEKANPGRVREIKSRRRAKLNGAPVNDLTAHEWEAMKRYYDYRCAYCGKKTVALTQDHITPLSKGGNHTMKNIVPACRSCNSRKCAGPPLKPVQPLLLINEL